MVRTARNKAILKSVDRRIQIDSSKAELNLSRLITEFSRSRTNAELYGLVKECTEQFAAEDEAKFRHLPSWSDEWAARYPNFHFNKLIHDAAQQDCAIRRKWFCFRRLIKKVTPLEFRRMNTVIDQYLHDNSAGNRFFDVEPVPGF